jgi:ferredoxin
MQHTKSTKSHSIIPLQQTAPQPSFDLLALPGVGRLLRWRHARTLLQLPLLAIAALMVWDGLTGSQLAPRNLATVITWVHYRGVLVLALLMVGNLFCMACPFMLPRNMARRFFTPARMWPKRLRNKWVAVALLALFFFTYELFDLWATPWWTAWLIVGYFAAAFVVDSLFKGASFCKYVCPIGQFNFVSSLVSPFEVKIRSPQTCADCRTKDCIAGNATQRGCELWLFQPRKVGNMDCTFCLDCVHACPYDNIGISTRLPGSDIWASGFRSGIGALTKRPDIAALVLVFTFGALLNAFGMVSPVYALEQWLMHMLGTPYEAPALGLIFAVGLVVEPLVLIGLTGWAARWLSNAQESLLPFIMRYVYALVPLGFGIWLSHYAFHFLTGFWTLVPVLQSTARDLGLPLIGPARWPLGAGLPAGMVQPVEFGFISLGLFGGLLVLWQLVQRDAPRHAWRIFVPWTVLLLILAACAFWLMAQPMEMRAIG